MINCWILGNPMAKLGMFYINVSTTDGNTTCLAKKDQLLPLGIMMIEHYEIAGYQIFRQTHKGMIFPKN